MNLELIPTLHSGLLSDDYVGYPADDLSILRSILAGKQIRTDSLIRERFLLGYILWIEVRKRFRRPTPVQNFGRNE